MLFLFEDGGLHPRMAYVLDGGPAHFAEARASASRFTLRKSCSRKGERALNSGSARADAR